MNKTLKITLIVVAALAGAALLVTSGLFIGRNLAGGRAYADGRHPFNFMRRFEYESQPYGRGPGMMRRGYSPGNANPAEPALPYGGGPGRMGGWMMRGGFAPYSGEPLTIAEAKAAFDAYLAGLNNPDLKVGEVMVFNQNAYAVITEKSSGLGAMELLAEHANGFVHPEFGPNMMWNQKYGMMGRGRGNFWGGGCCAGAWSQNEDIEFSPMKIGPDEARAIGQAYLDDEISGANLADEGFTFYGYYTFDYSVNGAMAGMLSVNGTNGSVWLHDWHGEFIEEADFD